MRLFIRQTTIFSFLIFVLSLLPVSLLANNNEILWELELDKDIVTTAPIDDGHILLGFKDSMSVIDAETGAIIWTINDSAKISSYNIDYILETDNILLGRAMKVPISKTGKNGVSWKKRYVTSLINYKTGSIIWDSRDIGIHFTKGEFILPSIGAIMIYLSDSAKNHSMILIDYKTGMEIWHNDYFFNGKDPNLLSQPGVSHTLSGNQLPMFDTDETFITFMAKKALQKWNIKTGELIWETEIKTSKLPTIKDGYPSMKFGDDNHILYVPYKKTMIAVNTDDGSILWELSKKLKGQIHQLEVTSYGLLLKRDNNRKSIKGKPCLTLIDLKTGELIWNWNKLGQFAFKSHILLEENQAVVYYGSKLYSISLEDGKANKFAKSLKFKYSEFPQALLKHDTDYVLVASNNLMRIDKSGQKLFHTHHKLPEPQIGVLQGLAMIALMAIAVSQNYMLIPTSTNSSSDIPPHPDSKQSIQFKKSWYEKPYSYMYTTVRVGPKKGRGVKKIKKESGETEMQIILKDATLNIMANESQTRLFQLTKKNVLRCYDF